MAASNSMNVDLTGSQPSELVEGAFTRLTRDALSQLRSPKASDLARSRVVSSNKKKGDSGRGPGKVSKKSTTLKTNFVDTRIREFKDEPFRKSNNKLFCEACREELSEKASIIKRHVDSKKHKSGVEKIAKKKKRDLTVLDAMKNYDKEVHPKGEMLSDNQRVFRVRVLKTFLKAGVPLQKMDDFRELLEEGGYRLTSVPNMRQLIPFVRKEEEEMIKGEISGHNVSVIFDGTTRLGEALAIVVRFITADTADSEISKRRRIGSRNHHGSCKTIQCAKQQSLCSNEGWSLGLRSCHENCEGSLPKGGGCPLFFPCN